MVDSFASDTREDFFEDGKSFKVTIIIDGSNAVFVEVEMVNHVDIAEVGSGGFVSDIDWMF